MADNVQLPVTGTGTPDIVQATDDVAGVHYPIVKISDGTLGGTGLIGGDATNGLDVDITRIAAGDNNIGNVDIVTMPGVAGTIAHDSADSGNPVKVGGRAVSSLAGVTLVAAADRSDFYSDLDGAQIIRPYCPHADIKSQRVADTGGSSTAFTALGAVASTYNYLTSIVVFNSSATPCFVDIRDGTGGSVLFTVGAPAGGGTAISFPVPLRQPTANTALAYDVSAALSTVYISIIGFQSKA